MFKLFALSALASVAVAAPDPQVLVADGVAAAHVAPVVGAVPPNCAIEYESIPTKTCTPRAETVCDTIDIDHHVIEYSEICKDVTSKHCPAPYHHGLVKREAEAEAEADPYFYGLHGGYAHVAPVAAPAVAAPAAVATVKHGCHEVTAKHCVQSPEAVNKPVPVERCHVTQKVDCVETEQQVAKTVCEEVETKVLQPLAHPFAYAGYAHHYGKK